jgi:hypothetical protein
MDVIAATMYNGEPRYMLTVTDREAFDYFKNCGWQVISSWTGKMGSLLVPPGEEEEHDVRRRKLGKATLAEMREGKGIGGFLADLMRKIDRAEN